jgi:hypothetical protein
MSPAHSPPRAFPLTPHTSLLRGFVRLWLLFLPAKEEFTTKSRIHEKEGGRSASAHSPPRAFPFTPHTSLLRGFVRLWLLFLSVKEEFTTKSRIHERKSFTRFSYFRAFVVLLSSEKKGIYHETAKARKRGREKRLSAFAPRAFPFTPHTLLLRGFVRLWLLFLPAKEEFTTKSRIHEGKSFTRFSCFRAFVVLLSSEKKGIYHETAKARKRGREKRLSAFAPRAFPLTPHTSLLRGFVRSWLLFLSAKGEFTTKS